jgi:hypothetical protein
MTTRQAFGSTGPPLHLDEALVHREERIGRDDLHVVWLDGLSCDGERHGHRGFLRQNLGEQLNPFKPSSGGANSHNEAGRLATRF